MSFLTSVSGAVKQAGLFVKHDPVYCAIIAAKIASAYWLYVNTKVKFCTENEEKNKYTIFSLELFNGIDYWNLFAMELPYKKLKDDSIN